MIIQYSPARAAEDYRKRLVVAVPGLEVLIRSSEPDSSVDCPSRVKWWQYWKKKQGNVGWWIDDKTISITCLPETTTSATVTTVTTEKTTAAPTLTTETVSEGIHQNVIIGASLGGAVFLLVILAFCAVCFCKRRGANLERHDMVDENPVYMNDYADPDENNEVYDTNAYYGVADVDTEGSTVAIDLNPDYE